ncbi:MAG: hypothetical protein QF579_05095 [Dehalococcoidia bacterium]|nr:hypothetical protein [Dehalococcoidia bacterium]
MVGDSESDGHSHLPLMANEEMEMSFGERHGLEADVTTDGNTMVLTDRRLIRLSKSGTSWDVHFMSLPDIQVAEVRRTVRGKGPLLRVALLLAGAISAMATIGFLPLAIPLATVLVLAGSYRLLRYLSVSQEGAILFHVGQEELGISFEGNMANQAYSFINRFFHLKEVFSLAREVSAQGTIGGGLVGPSVPQEQVWQGMEEVQIESVATQSDENLVESHEETIPHDEPLEGTDQREKTS